MREPLVDASRVKDVGTAEHAQVVTLMELLQTNRAPSLTHWDGNLLAPRPHVQSRDGFWTQPTPARPEGHVKMRLGNGGDAGVALALGHGLKFREGSDDVVLLKEGTPEVKMNEATEGRNVRCPSQELNGAVHVAKIKQQVGNSAQRCHVTGVYEKRCLEMPTRPPGIGCPECLALSDMPSQGTVDLFRDDRGRTFIEPLQDTLHIQSVKDGTREASRRKTISH